MVGVKEEAFDFMQMRVNKLTKKENIKRQNR